MNKKETEAFYCVCTMASQESVPARQEENKEERYRNLLAQLAEAKQDPLFQSLVNPPIEGLALPFKGTGLLKKEGNEPVNAIIICIHTRPPHHTMKAVDGPIVPTREHTAYLL